MPESVPRFAQLTYTSHRPGEHAAGGWQVKDTVGELTDDETHDLVGEIATTFPLETELPAFLSPDQHATLPNRLAYAVVGRGAAYWHTVPAGNDSTNRPRNVFVHVLLDRRPRDPDPALRPSDLLHSPMWLRPYGPVEVAGASPAPIGAEPVTGDLDRSATVAFLVEEALRSPGVLAGLLDGVVGALRDGPQVVLVARPDRADRWIAAISHLMSAGTARTLRWSNREQAEDLARGPVPGLDLVVVDPASFPPSTLPTSVAVVPDDPDAVWLGDLAAGEPHRTRHGEIPVTPWSAIAPVVLQDEVTAADVLARLDACAARVGDRDLTCAWPLSMAVCQRPEGLADARAEAEMVLLAESPEGLDPETRQMVRALRTRSLGRTPAEAWTAYEGRTRRGIPDALAASVYLELALSDPSWLLRRGRLPVPVGPVAVEPETLEAARTSLARLLRDVERRIPEPRDAVLALRTAQLCLAAGLPDPGVPDDGPRGDVAAVLDRVVVPVLAQPETARAVIENASPLTDATLVALRARVDGWLPKSPRPVGDRLAPATLAWLFPTPPPVPAATVLAGRAEFPPSVVELAAQVTAVVADPSAFRALAVRTVLTDPDVGGRGPDLVHLAAGPPLPPSELVALLEHTEPTVLASFLAPALLEAPECDAVARIVDAVRRRPPGAGPSGEVASRIVRVAAELRHHASAWTEAKDLRTVNASSVSALAGAEELLGLVEEPALPGSVVGSLLAAYLVDVVDGLATDAEPRSLPRLERWIRATARRVPVTVEPLVGHAIEVGAINDVEVAMVAQIAARPDYQLRPLAGWEGPRLVAVPATAAGSTTTLLELVVRRRLLPSRDAAATSELVETVRREAARVLRRAQVGRERNRLIDEHEDFARRWWADLGVSTGSGRWHRR
ncbi:hypothetical protein [Actinomycetospora sp. CA-084318]|uniref:GAP1-N2 domain-containing protein n=1 Tax=Actinomycetospora sp. CA-084318 TaxID=3239892 RepID=UPI003D972CD4